MAVAVIFIEQRTFRITSVKLPGHRIRITSAWVLQITFLSRSTAMKSWSRSQPHRAGLHPSTRLSAPLHLRPTTLDLSVMAAYRCAHSTPRTVDRADGGVGADLGQRHHPHHPGHALRLVPRLAAAPERAGVCGRVGNIEDDPAERSDPLVGEEPALCPELKSETDLSGQVYRYRLGSVRNGLPWRSTSRPWTGTCPT